MSHYFQVQNGFFWEILLAMFSGLVTWIATKAGVHAAFRMEKAEKEREKIRSKGNLIGQLTDELEMAIKELKGVESGSLSVIQTGFPVFHSTIDLQVEYFIAASPSFSKRIHWYYDKLMTEIDKFKHLADPAAEMPAGELQGLKDYAVSIRMFLEELVVFLRNEMTARERRIYEQMQGEARKEGD